MDYINGEDIQKIIDNSNDFLDVNRVVEWMMDVLRTLGYIHSQKIIHRDIKPGNIKIDDSNRAILIDFGIPKDYNKMLTAPGARGAFTPYMASPEQCQACGQTTPASDIYSVGATLYYCLTLGYPTDAISRVMGKPVTNPQQINPNISHELSQIIMKAISINATDGFQTAREFLKELLKWKNVNQNKTNNQYIQKNTNKHLDGI